MHKEVLLKEQEELLPVLKNFSNDFVLCGGTAIAFQLGHRRSIDFDLAKAEYFNSLEIRNKISKFFKIDQVIRDGKEEYTVVANGVKLTFFYYPFKIKALVNLMDFIKMPDIETLAAMKAYALGRRAKWKDYVDLYFIADKYSGLEKIIRRAKDLFNNEFNEKNFRTQLSYFKDVDYTEKVIYMPGFEVDDESIKDFLKELSVQTN